jgi:hypothetical protein
MNYLTFSTSSCVCQHVLVSNGNAHLSLYIKAAVTLVNSVIRTHVFFIHFLWLSDKQQELAVNAGLCNGYAVFSEREELNL